MSWEACIAPDCVDDVAYTGTRFIATTHIMPTLEKAGWKPVVLLAKALTPDQADAAIRGYQGDIDAARKQFATVNGTACCPTCGGLVCASFITMGTAASVLHIGPKDPWTCLGCGWTGDTKALVKTGLSAHERLALVKKMHQDATTLPCR